MPFPVLGLPPNPISGPLTVGPAWPVAAALAMHQIRHRFDLWHVHSIYPAGWMAHGILTRMGVPVILTPHGADVQVEAAAGYGLRRAAKHDRRIRRLVAGARWLTAITPTMAQTLRDLGARPEAVQEIPNGVPAARIAGQVARGSGARQRLGLPPGAPVLLSVGRNEPHKGLQFVPPVLRRLRDAGLDVHWIVVGQDAGALEAAAAGLGVEGFLRCLPPIAGDATAGDSAPPAGLIDLYAGADVFVMPSLMESFGLVALEAMAAGTPVVASDISGLANVVGDGEAGLTFPPGDVAAMAAAVARVLRDGDLRRRLTRNGAAKAAAHDWRMVAARYLALYARACGAAAPGGAGTPDTMRA
jgi:glycosyltransferase involved in cell wall biosynthesis